MTAGDADDASQIDERQPVSESYRISVDVGGSSVRVARGEADGTLLRRVTVEDDLLLARLEQNRAEAIAACSKRLQERGITTPLMDVEHLFDGGSLYFYFLGEVTDELEAITGELAEAYEAKVQFRQFTDAVDAGCPDDRMAHAT